MSHSSLLNGFEYCYLSLTFQLNISHFFTHKWSNSSISNNSISYKSFVCTRFKSQTVLFDPQIGPLSGVITLGQSGPGSSGNEEVFHIPQDWGHIIRLFCVIWSGHSLVLVLVGVGSYLSEEMHSMYATAPADWAGSFLGKELLVISNN